MNSNRSATLQVLRRLAPIAIALVTLVSATRADDPEGARARALELYDAGRYDEARRLLEQLDASGEATGPDLYRLYFCQRAAGDAAAHETRQRARKRLESEVDAAPGLEVPFYLANVYSNLGRNDDARRVAARATERFEAGAIAEPTSGVEAFRLGKLYADQDWNDAAARWYADAVQRFEAEGAETSRPYVVWASRFLAERAWSDKDYDAVARWLSHVPVAEASAVELDHLAEALARTGRYGEAKTAWQSAERADPSDANRPRYCWRLAAQADEVGSLPAAAPDGRPWAEWTSDELRTLMIDESNVAKETQAEAQAAEKLKKKQRRKMQARLDEARAMFVAAALEYAYRHEGIRETAFTGGFAPLIFHGREWRLKES